MDLGEHKRTVRIEPATIPVPQREIRREVEQPIEQPATVETEK